MKRNLRAVLLLGWLAAALATTTSAETASAPPIKAIVFAKGTVVASFRGAVARGELALYRFDARAGQRLKLAASTVDGNVSLQIYRPGFRLPAAAGEDIIGTTLPGAGAYDDARGWAGRLPKTGPYLLVVGANHGGSEYLVSISIR